MVNVTESKTFQDMLKAAAIVRDFNARSENTSAFRSLVQKSLDQAGLVHVVAEGSSRFFPCGNLVYMSADQKNAPAIRTFNGMQAQDAKYNHDDATVILISNSGETEEVLALGHQLKTQNHENVFAITAHRGSHLNALCGDDKTHILSCGEEQAIAATMSVVEQTLFLQSAVLGLSPSSESCEQTASQMTHILTNMEIPEDLIERLAVSSSIYFSNGAQNGIGSELSLKFSETVLRSVYLDGTTAVHGYQETMAADATVILIDLPKAYEAKFEDTLVTKAGLNVLAINKTDTAFPTIKIPAAHPPHDGILQLAAGWRLMSEISRVNDIDIDKPRLAEKVGFRSTSLKPQ